MRAHADPADFSLTPDHKGGTPRQINGVYSESLIDTISLRYFSFLVEKNGKGITVFVEVFLALEETVNLLGGYEYDTGVYLREFAVSGLKLSQLVLAVRSPGTADKYQDERLAAVVGEADSPAIHIR